jgi:hypothetical protein
VSGLTVAARSIPTLLGIWLIGTGLMPLIRIHIPGSGIILAVLALAAGVFILFGR